MTQLKPSREKVHLACSGLVDRKSGPCHWTIPVRAGENSSADRLALGGPSPNGQQVLERHSSASDAVHEFGRGNLGHTRMCSSLAPIPRFIFNLYSICCTSTSRCMVHCVAPHHSLHLALRHTTAVLGFTDLLIASSRYSKVPHG